MFVTDFPKDSLSKNAFVRKGPKQTFGNDKPLTNSSYKPSYGMAVGEVTKVLMIPYHEIEKAVNKC